MAPRADLQPTDSADLPTYPLVTWSVAMLVAHGVGTLLDVRTIPGSRRQPRQPLGPGRDRDGGLQRRQIRALAKASLWKIRPLAPILDRMGQVPIERGAGDAGALDAAIAELRAGACIGVFPEGTISRGTELARPQRRRPPRSAGAGGARRLRRRRSARSTSSRFPKRPRITVEFFDPEGGQPDPDEDPAALSARFLAEIRAKAPIAKAGVGQAPRPRQRRRRAPSAAAQPRLRPAPAARRARRCRSRPTC